MFNLSLEQIRAFQTGYSSTNSGYTYNSSVTAQVVGLNNGSTGPVGTFTTSQIIDGICEGPIEGWPTTDPYKHLYLDGTPAITYDNAVNIPNLKMEYRLGTSDQTPLSNYTLIGAVKAPNFQGELLDVGNGGTAVIQQVQIRDDTDGAYPSVEAVSFTFSFPEGLFRYQKDGGRDNTSARIKIEMSPYAETNGGWSTPVDDYWNQEITGGGFEITYVIEIPPGWSVPKALQGYSPTSLADDVIQFRISKSDSDYTNDRAHSKIYLKSYSIYTRNQFSHPYTALVGLTIDSKNFDGSIPRRQYDLKLLKVKIPSNYSLVTDPKTGEILERNYEGQWNGTFKDGLHWTDNPVWCFYDLVTNTRYGLGKFIDPSILNKWKLYEIAKYCDAVVADTRPGKPANSFTFSAPDNLGGIPAAAGNSVVKEPRFTCNAVIANREEAYSLVQKFASLFRAITYFQSGGLQLIQDKPATPIYLYNNTNVIDGVFSYQSSSAKARHTVAIVKWLDPNDLYSEKLEYVEDYDGIARYGYREIEIDGFGCTSRGQARRIGRHILITEKFELETLSFKVGAEGAVVTPGSLIKIKDSSRQSERAGGRIVSATSTSITIDKAVNIPAGATAITLWVQTPTSLNETIEGTTFETYRPTLTSHSITAGAGSSNLTTLTLSSGSFSTTPTAGNMWILSYIPSGSSENTSVYKVLSVVENSSFEYEITALQHYSNKYDEIEAYAPIPEYKPEALKLYTPPPEEGFVTSEFNGRGFNLQVFWRSSRFISGTKYKIEVINGSSIRTYFVSGATSYTLENAPYGIYYFKVYTLNDLAKESSEPLIIGPYKLKLSMAQNSFNTFSSDRVGVDYITNSWSQDLFSDTSIKYEVWRGTSNSLRSLATSANIKNISYDTNKVTLHSFEQSSIGTATSYWVEIPMLPYPKYTAANVGVSSTNSTTILLSTLEKPSISIGDKVTNSTRNVTSNVVSVTQSKGTDARWISTVTITPSISGQVATDIVYFYKGVIGSSFVESQPSGAIEQKTISAIAGTTTTNITVATGGFTNVSTGDIMVNRTRGVASIITKVNNQNVTTSSIAGQTSGDIIAFYQKNTREVRNLKKFRIDYLSTAFGGDLINVLNFDDADSMPQPNNSIMVNVTRGVCAEVVYTQIQPGGVLKIGTQPSLIAQGIADNDEVFFINKNEVFTQSRNTHIHPSAAATTAGTNTTTVFATGLFTSAKVGDILVNATRNTSSVIITKNSNNQVTLLGSIIPSLAITGQTVGDIVFYVAISSFVENLSYTHPTILTATTGTSPSVVNITTSGFAGINTSYRFYNMTQNASASISSVTDNDTIVVSPTITGQQSGDRCYVYLPTEVTTGIVTAPDGAFNFARPGDTFHNITRSTYSTIKDVVSLTGDIDKKIDKLILASTVSGQAAGDSFRILQGFFSSQVLSKENNTSAPTDDILQLETVQNIEIGDRADIYLMNASMAGSTAGTLLTDTGLSPSTTYYYWMRALNNDFPFLTGGWRPTSTTGQAATTSASIAVTTNYNSSNDNNSDPINPNAITPVSPFIDLPPGGVNADSTANIRLYWEWTGVPHSIDGFSVYFWSSNSITDDPNIDADEDYTQFTSSFSVEANPRLRIGTLTYVGTTVTASTVERHDFSNGTKVKILGAENTLGSPMANVNTISSPAAFVTVTVTSPKGFTYTAPATPTGTYSPESGTATSSAYSYQIDNLTANYYYNAWIQPYRQVNTIISETGIIVGSPRKLY